MPTLQALCDGGRRPILVVSQPARHGGRGRRLLEPPVASWARSRGIEVIQPQDVRDSEFLQRLESAAPTVVVVVAFGQILPAAVLELPPRGCINLHASLLPRYRGASPIQAAIVAGERKTGISTMLMDAGLDTGPILLQEEVSIGDEETSGMLAARLAERGALLMIKTLDALERGALEPRPQSDEEASIARRLRRSDGLIDWRQDAQSIFNLLRGLSPWPGTTSTLRRRPIKILWGRPSDVEVLSATEPGTCLGLRREKLVVQCGSETTFGIERLQRPGRKPLSAIAFANGEHLEAGERFGC